MNANLSEPIFSSNDSPESTFDAKPLRGSAIAALVLGIASIVALGGPYLWFVPVAAIVCGVIALRPSPVPIAGKGIATLGLTLALFFLSWSAWSKRTYEHQRREVAVENALKWIETLQTGAIELCFELTLSPSQRHAASYDLKQYYAKFADATEDELAMDMDSSPGFQFQQFQKSDGVKAIVSAGSSANWNLTQWRRYSSHPLVTSWKLTFQDTSVAHGTAIVVSIKEMGDDQGQVEWEISTPERAGSKR